MNQLIHVIVPINCQRPQYSVQIIDPFCFSIKAGSALLFPNENHPHKNKEKNNFKLFAIQ